MLKPYHSRDAGRGKQEVTPETAAPAKAPIVLVCAEASRDYGLTVLSDGQQSGRLSNSDFLSDIEAQLSLLPAYPLPCLAIL